MTRCVIGDREHEAHHGYLCDGHLQKLSAMLRAVEDETIHLSAVPSMQQTNARPGGLASHRAPARIDVLVHLDPRRGTGTPLVGEPDPEGWDDTASVLDVLGSWARLVREERGLAAAEKVTVTGERALLTRQLEWVAEQPWCDEMFEDLRALLAQLKRANGTYEAPVGDCESLQPDSSVCGGKVWHVVIRHDDGPDEPGFRCGACRRVWTGTEAVRKRDALWRAELARKEAG